MALYLVLHHRNAKPHPSWSNNKWLDDDIIERITTTPGIAALCSQADVVFIHRCKWRGDGPIISCSVKVLGVNGNDVRFHNGVRLLKAPPMRVYGWKHYQHP